jgi:predicted DNA-binding mobile mystery protein A
MTGAQLAERLGIKQPSVAEFERNEVEHRITLETLDRAAKAMGCRLVYALVPEQSLETTVQLRARAVARKRMSHVGRTMRLEDQEMDKDAEAWHLERLTQQLAADAPSSLWDEDDTVLRG